MINTEKGSIHVKGSTTELLTDLSIIIKSLHDNLSKDLGPEISKEMITEAVNVGFLSEDEVHKKLNEAKMELLMKIFGRMV